jgi:hypothetical protein
LAPISFNNFFLYCENSVIAGIENDDELQTYFGLIPRPLLTPEKHIKFSTEYPNPCPGVIGENFKKSLRETCLNKSECLITNLTQIFD